jgi:hypothetical protein
MIEHVSDETIMNELMYNKLRSESYCRYKYYISWKYYVKFLSFDILLHM